MKDNDLGRIIRFAIPVVLEHLFTQVIAMIVPALIGGISGSALAAVGIVNQTATVYTSAFALMSTGGGVLLAALDALAVFDVSHRNDSFRAAPALGYAPFQCSVWILLHRKPGAGIAALPQECAPAFLCLAKEKPPRPVEKKSLFAANPRPCGHRFAYIREWLVRSASGILRVPCRVRRTHFHAEVLPRIWRFWYWLGVVEGNLSLLPRCRYPALISQPLPIPGGRIQRRGPQPPPLSRFKGVRGEIEIPPGFLFGVWGIFLFQKEMSPTVSLHRTRCNLFTDSSAARWPR